MINVIDNNGWIIFISYIAFASCILAFYASFEVKVSSSLKGHDERLWPMTLQDIIHLDNDAVFLASLQGLLSFCLLFCCNFGPKYIHLWDTEPISFLSSMTGDHSLHYLTMHLFAALFEQMNVAPSDIWKLYHSC